VSVCGMDCVVYLMLVDACLEEETISEHSLQMNNLESLLRTSPHNTESASQQHGPLDLDFGINQRRYI
jgi:hypothetical protein